MKIVHFVAGLAGNNGMANTAREFAAEEVARGDEAVVTNDLAAISQGTDEVCIHGAWLPVLWKAAKRAKVMGARLVIRPAGSYDPVRLAYHVWKKKIVAPFEHRMLRRADVLMATCEAEMDWIRAYEPRVKKIEVTDLKRFFDLNHGIHGIHGIHERVEGRPLHLLYLGRRHPLKGVEFLEEAVKDVEGCELRIVSNAFGEEKEKVWAWCDVLALPTLSENFGRVVAEALERGKRVITTDGAPAWAPSASATDDNGSDCGGRLIYLKGYRDGTNEKRVQLLKSAIEELGVRR